MWTAEKFIKVLQDGRVITKKDLMKIIVEIRESEHEAGAAKMRELYSNLSKKIRDAKKKKKDIEFHQIVNEISDYVYIQKQENYYGPDGIDKFGKRIEKDNNEKKRIGKR